MSKNKKKFKKPTEEVEIINRRTKETRKVYLNKKEIIIYNDDLNEFQLLSAISASYDEDNKPNNERER
jgi:hypothetical protein|tara:strand:+ start:599 stop:802 length:204 start_codon:yes stop_codon:yes gene_type:complete